LQKNKETFGSKPALSKIRERIQWFREGKNWVMSNAKVLVKLFLTQLVQMKCVKVTPASDKESYFKLPS